VRDTPPSLTRSLLFLVPNSVLLLVNSDVPVVEELVFAWIHEKINRVAGDPPLSATPLGAKVPSSWSINCKVLTFEPINKHIDLGHPDVSVTPLLELEFLSFIVLLAQAT